MACVWLLRKGESETDEERIGPVEEAVGLFKELKITKPRAKCHHVVGML